MLKPMMPALLLLALLNATTPAAARGLMPVCTQTGIIWVYPDGQGDGSPDSGNICPHGWCKPRKPRGEKGGLPV